MKNSNEQTLPKKRAKKAYEQPRLQVYGDLRDITQSHMMGMNMDASMTMGLNKTT